MTYSKTRGHSRWTVAATIAVAGAVLSVTGCSQPATPEESGPVELQMLFPIAATGKIAETMEKLADDFNSSQDDITVEPIYSGSYQDTMTKARAMFDAGTPPDLLIASSAELFNLLDLDIIVPYEEVLGDDDTGWLERYFPALMVNSVYDGQTYGVPFQRSTILQYINKDALEAAGLDRDTVPATWDELRDVAVQVSESDGGAEFGLEIPTTSFGDWLFSALAWQNGHELVSDDGTQTFYDDPKAVEALEFWIGLGEVGATPEGSVAWATTPKDFIEGKTAIIWTTSGNLGAIRDQAPFDFTVSPLPAGTQAGSPTGGANLYIVNNEKPRNQKASAAFVEWITSPERSAEWSIATGYVASSEAAYETDLMRDYASEFPEGVVAKDQLQVFTRALGLYGNSRAIEALREGIEAALAGTKPADQALADAQSTADQVLKRYR